MKKIILPVTMLIAASVSKAQTTTQPTTQTATQTTQSAASVPALQNNYTGVYKWKEVVQMQKCKIDGTGTGLNFTVSSIVNAQRFIVVNVAGNFAIIKLWDYTIYDPHTSSANNREDQLTGDEISFAGKAEDSNGGKKTHTNDTYTADKFYKAKANFFLYNFDGTVTDYSKLSATAVNTRNYGDKQIYFKVPITYINQYAVKSVHIAGSLALGAINYPFKYRLLAGQSDFSGSFNLGAAVGYKLPHDSLSKWTVTAPLLAFSVSTVNIDSVSAQRNQSLLKATNNFSAISFATGVILENNKIQIGLFLGLDKISRINNLQYGWIYQNKPWFSIGFGYSLFSTEKQSSGNGDATQSNN